MAKNNGEILKMQQRARAELGDKPMSVEVTIRFEYDPTKAHEIIERARHDYSEDIPWQKTNPEFPDDLEKMLNVPPQEAIGDIQDALDYLLTEAAEDALRDLEIEYVESSVTLPILATDHPHDIQ